MVEALGLVFVIAAPFVLVLVEVLLVVVFEVVALGAILESWAKLTDPITTRAAANVKIFFILCDFFCKVNIKVSNWKFLF